MKPSRLTSRNSACDPLVQETAQAESIFAAVVTWNRPALLVECVRRLLAQTRTIGGVVVYDNGSKEPVQDHLDAAGIRDPRVHVLRSDRNEGGTAGFARAMREAVRLGAAWVWVMDDDAHVEPDAAARMLPHLRPHVAAVANYKVDSRGEPLKNHIDPFDDNLPDGAPLRFSSFVGICVASRSIAAVGYPDERFFTQYDDNEYCQRLSRIGPILLAKESRIVHLYERLATETAPPLIDVVRYFQIRNFLWVVRRRSGILAAATAAFPLYFRLAIWALKSSPRGASLWFVTHAVLCGLTGYVDNGFPFACKSRLQKAVRSSPTI